MRAERGEPPLPDDDINKMFKPPMVPTRLDSLLLSGQISAYATQMSQFASQTFGKLFMIDSLQEADSTGAAASSKSS
jgi:translation initiation factor 3 subunit H